MKLSSATLLILPFLLNIGCSANSGSDSNSADSALPPTSLENPATPPAETPEATDQPTTNADFSDLFYFTTGACSGLLEDHFLESRELVIGTSPSGETILGKFTLLLKPNHAAQVIYTEMDTFVYRPDHYEWRKERVRVRPSRWEIVNGKMFVYAFGPGYRPNPTKRHQINFVAESDFLTPGLRGQVISFSLYSSARIRSSYFGDISDLTACPTEESNAGPYAKYFARTNQTQLDLSSLKYAISFVRDSSGVVENGTLEVFLFPELQTRVVLTVHENGIEKRYLASGIWSRDTKFTHGADTVITWGDVSLSSYTNPDVKQILFNTVDLSDFTGKGFRLNPVQTDFIGFGPSPLHPDDL